MNIAKVGRVCMGTAKKKNYIYIYLYIYIYSLYLSLLRRGSIKYTYFCGILCSVESRVSLR